MCRQNFFYRLNLHSTPINKLLTIFCTINCICVDPFTPLPNTRSDRVRPSSRNSDYNKSYPLRTTIIFRPPKTSRDITKCKRRPLQYDGRVRVPPTEDSGEGGPPPGRGTETPTTGVPKEVGVSRQPRKYPRKDAHEEGHYEEGHPRGRTLMRKDVHEEGHSRERMSTRKDTHEEGYPQGRTLTRKDTHEEGHSRGRTLTSKSRGASRHERKERCERVRHRWRHRVRH